MPKSQSSAESDRSLPALRVAFGSREQVANIAASMREWGWSCATNQNQTPGVACPMYQSELLVPATKACRRPLESSAAVGPFTKPPPKEPQFDHVLLP